MNKQTDAFFEKYKIAGVVVSLSAEFSCSHDNLSAFKVNDEETSDLDITVVRRVTDTADTSVGTRIFSSSYMDVYENDSNFRFVYSSSPFLDYCEYDSVGRKACIVASPVQEPEVDSRGYSLKDHIFFAIRDAFFCLCQQHNMIALHSSSIIYKGRAYLFSAPSGTGKTTHTDMWVKQYNVPVLNGDVALLSVSDGTVNVHGIPWCGTSGKYMNETVPLGDIIFLKRDSSNSLSVMNSFEAVLNICARSFSPNWNKPLTERTLAVAREIESISDCLLLNCLPEESAMELVKEYIDR